MKVHEPRGLAPGQTLHWHDGSTAKVKNVTWGGVLVQWDDGKRVLYPFDDNAWHYFKIYEDHTQDAPSAEDSARARRLRRKYYR